MAVFVTEKRRFTVHLRPEDVHDALLGRGGTERRGARALPGTEDDHGPDDRHGGGGGEVLADLAAVVETLDRLVQWGNLRADPDTSRVTTVEDFHRARFLYQITREGEVAERALALYEEQLGRPGALQSVALADIATSLRALRELARGGDPGPDPARAGLLLRDLMGRLAELADNAQAFMGSLQRTIDLYDADVEAFLAYKDRLVDYLERFVRDLVTVGGEIAGLLGEFPDADVSRLFAAAARRDAQDAAPDAEAALAGAQDREGEAYLAELVAWRERWLGLQRWFLSEPGHPSQAKLLRARARSAIPQLLAVVSSINERRTGRSDRSADLRALARWFAQAPDDVAMHRLWRVAFGLSSSRHMMIDGDAMLARAENPVPAGTPWSQAPPLQISPQLRRTGSYERRGRPNRVVSRREQQRLLADLAARQTAQIAAARARLATTQPVRLGELGELDPTAFGLFLTLLGDALGARVHGERQVDTTTADGTIRVRLTALEDGTRATIHTPAGVLHGPDHIVEILDLAPGPTTAAENEIEKGEIAA
jgi:uncharacterized protein (TIGR02677 family)